MTTENRGKNLEAEVEKGEESLREAQALLDLRLWNGAVSRAYYAAFHHVQALLFTLGLEARTHAGTHDLFYLNFVRPGLVPVQVAKKLAALQKYREQADYSRAFRFDEPGAREEVASASEICQALRAHMEASGWLKRKA